jgi:glycosyltransferase involved in cell wall biosynthesis
MSFLGGPRGIGGEAFRPNSRRSTTKAAITTSGNMPQRENELNDEQSGFGMTVHAVFPPPITGMSLCTEAVANAVAGHVSVRRFNWSNQSARINNWFRFVKSLRALLGPFRLLLSKRGEHAVFYMPCNAGFACCYNFLAIAAARLRGYRCVLHHHYFRYVDRFERRISWISSLLGPNDLQIVLCPAMESAFRARYGSSLPLAIMPSTIQLLKSSAEEDGQWTFRKPSGPFRIGHLSNLELAKGLDLVLEVFRALRQQDRDVRLLLAGPARGSVERRMIDAAQVEFGERLEYLGPVYGPAKRDFWRGIDASVYPTRNDAQPLVIMEAFSAGKPVISFGRGCIPGMMPSAAWAIDTNADFVQLASKEIERWLDCPDDYESDCRLSRQTYDAGIQEAKVALAGFVNWVCGTPDEGFVRRGDEKLGPLLDKK